MNAHRPVPAKRVYEAELVDEQHASGRRIGDLGAFRLGAAEFFRGRLPRRHGAAFVAWLPVMGEHGHPERG